MADKDIMIKPPTIAIAPISNGQHRFQPGHAPFKPKGITELRMAARGMSLQMLQVMIDIALDTDERGSVRLAAADLVMTRGYGKAESYHDKEDKGLTAKATDLTSAEILAMLEQVQATVDPTDTEPRQIDTVSVEHSLQIDDASSVE